MDFSNGLLSEKLKERADQLNLKAERATFEDASSTPVGPSESTSGIRQGRTSHDIQQVSNSLSHRLISTDSPTTSSLRQNILRKRYICNQYTH